MRCSVSFFLLSPHDSLIIILMMFLLTTYYNTTVGYDTTRGMYVPWLVLPPCTSYTPPTRYVYTSYYYTKKRRAQEVKADVRRTSPAINIVTVLSTCTLMWMPGLCCVSYLIYYFSLHTVGQCARLSSDQMPREPMCHVYHRSVRAQRCMQKDYLAEAPGV